MATGGARSSPRKPSSILSAPDILFFLHDLFGSKRTEPPKRWWLLVALPFDPFEHGVLADCLIDTMSDDNGSAFDRAYELTDEEIGSGASSVVKVCRDRKTGVEYAVKIMRRKQALMDEGKFTQEISIMRALNHPNIIQIKGVFKTETEIRVIMELATGGELFERICEQNSFEERQAQEIAKSLFSALSHMHTKGIAHRDLKPENILFFDEKKDALVKIADFGFAKMSAKTSGGRRRMNTALGTQGYSAPEVFTGAEYTEKCDIWSMGVIIYILLCGLPPFIEIDEEELEEAFNCPFWVYVNQMTNDLDSLKLSFPKPLWENVSDIAKDFMRKIFIVDPESRPSAAELLRHRWLRGQFTSHKLSATMTHLRRFNHSRRNSFAGGAARTPRSRVSSTGGALLGDAKALGFRAPVAIHEEDPSQDAEVHENADSNAKTLRKNPLVSIPSDHSGVNSGQTSPAGCRTPSPPRAGRFSKNHPDHHTLPEPVKQRSLREWDEQEVSAWIKSLGNGRIWSQYADLCNRESVDGVTLLHADVESLVKFGFTRIHARAVVGEVAETLRPKIVIPPKPGTHGNAYALRPGVHSVPVFDGPGTQFKRIGKLGKGSVVHAVSEQAFWIRHRLGWSPKRNPETRRPILDRVLRPASPEAAAGPSVRPARAIDRNARIHSGILMKKSKHLRGWFKRYFALYEDRIMYYKPGASEPRGVIHLGIVKDVRAVGKYQMNITAGKKVISLKAGTTVERQDWMEYLAVQRSREGERRRSARGRVAFADEMLLTTSRNLAQHLTGVDLGRAMEEIAIEETHRRSSKTSLRRAATSAAQPQTPQTPPGRLQNASKTGLKDAKARTRRVRLFTR